MCPCGKPALARGLCRSCYARQRLARLRFGGHREPVIDRDGRQCTICSSADRLIVHHRRPGHNEPELLVTLCVPCHVRLHQAERFPTLVPDLLLTLWAEQHPARPLQLQLELA